MLIPNPASCDHQYVCVHFDGIYRCKYCRHMTRCPVNGPAPTDDALREALRAMSATPPAAE